MFLLFEMPNIELFFFWIFKKSWNWKDDNSCKQSVKKVTENMIKKPRKRMLPNKQLEYKQSKILKIF